MDIVALSALLPHAGILLLIALLISSIGFIRMVWFISIGYGFSIAGLAFAAPIMLYQQISAVGIIQCALLFIYGVRLGGFLLIRERSLSYQAESEEVARGTSRIGFGVRLAIWISVSLLYVAMFWPAFVRFAVPQMCVSVLRSATGWAGITVMILGLAIEGLADLQKSAFKKKQPRRFCDTGLFRLVRCPSYFGEITFWTGSLITGIPVLAGVIHWVIALAGWVCIVLIMLGSTRRLEIKQNDRYGSDPEYQTYSRRVPVLLPFVPVFSLKKLKVYLG